MKGATVAWLLAVPILVAAGCVPAYRPPTEAQPHAVLKFRRVYPQVFGTGLTEGLMLGEYRAVSARDASDMARAPRVDALLVHPVPTTATADSTFFHTESRLVTETYTEQVPYTTTETYNCGSGTSYRTCTRMVTRYRSETKTRQVWKTVEVVDAACRTQIAIDPRDGDVLLLEYDFAGASACRLSCIQQRVNPDGTFDNAPCRVPPPPAPR